MMNVRHVGTLLLACALAPAATAHAQTAVAWGRVAFTVQSFTSTQLGQAQPGFHEMVMAATLASPTRETAGTEYRLDFRGAAYPGTIGRTRRLSVYDAYVGQRVGGGVLVRAGQMWLNDLGGLGALGGALVEVARQKVAGFQRVRVGAFGGMEPTILDAGYAPGVVKAGAYVSFEGKGIWRNTVGFVTVRHSGLTERSVLTTTNFLPVGKALLVYQAAEYDMVGPAGNGNGGLTYFFTNARYAPVRRIEFQALYHRGRSIDVRGITLDQLAGRPVSSRALEGLLYESIGGRATFTVAQDIRVFAGYTRDRNNRDDAPTGRLNVGVFATDLLKTGLDLNVSDSRMHGPNASYDSWDISLGRNLTRRMYLSGDFSSSLSAFLLIGQTDVTIQSRPRTNRLSISDLIRLSGRISLLASADRTRDGDLTQLRWMMSLIYRF